MIYITALDLEDLDYLILCAIADKQPQPIDLCKLQVERISFPPFSRIVLQNVADAVMDAKPTSTGETKGLVIASTNTAEIAYVTGFLVSECQNRVPWMSGYHNGEAVIFKRLTPKRAIAEIVSARLFCLKCLEQGDRKILKVNALYPYCKAHQDYSPHRL